MYRKYVKRILDIIMAVILLVVLSPIMLITIIITIIDLGFPIHNTIRYREGQYKKPFLMYKIRTKKLGKEYVRDGSQYTKVSYVIDRLRLNEIPQLINVIKGDMSIVGPRPFIPNDDLPSDEISEKRYLVKPGITGLAQINGGRSISHKEKLEYDVIYYENLNFINDLKIIIKTPFSLYTKKTFKD